MLGRLQTSGIKLLSTTNDVLIKSTNQVLYYSKIGIELSKQVYLKEKLQPPNWQTFQKVYLDIFNGSLKFLNNPQSLLCKMNQYKRDDMIKFGAVGIQLAGFYTVGEMIGRRKLVGYRDYSHHHEEIKEA